MKVQSTLGPGGINQCTELEYQVCSPTHRRLVTNILEKPAGTSRINLRKIFAIELAFLLTRNEMGPTSLLKMIN